ncbi:MAG TPA: 2-C-methyl-D-erythritol 4-phosphate cytidylyltransferase [Gammaproteobacteria bacterium]|nr:2-C-methyl-D-erythritol 4-phosphate cytidylyltransferase [Gammaproteobacteria bacterium]
MPDATKFWAVIPAAGSGVRMGSSIPKQYLALAGRAVIEHVLEAFLSHPRIAGISVAVADSDPYWSRYATQPHAKPLQTANGGEQRAHSVRNALAGLSEQLQADDWVLVHDAVRPCLHRSDLDRLLTTLEQDAVGGVLGSPLTDTLKQVDDLGFITGTPSRQGIWRALTPQMFRYGLLCEALNAAISADQLPTDEAAAMERIQPGQVRMVEGRSDNLKITRPDDIAAAEAILARRAQGHA